MTNNVIKFGIRALFSGGIYEFKRKNRKNSYQYQCILSIGSNKVDELKDIVKNIKTTSYDGLILNISNPADVVTHYLQHELGWDEKKIFSTSTTLDSARLKRAIAEEIGINMHTVNKAYSVLRQEGLLRLDRRRGTVIALDIDRLKAEEEMRDSLRVVLARGFCKGINRAEVHELVDEIFDEYE